MDGEVVLVAERAILTVLSLAFGHLGSDTARGVPVSVRTFVRGPVARAATVFLSVALVVLSAPPRVARFAVPVAAVLAGAYYLAFRFCLTEGSRFCIVPASEATPRS